MWYAAAADREIFRSETLMFVVVTPRYIDISAGRFISSLLVVFADFGFIQPNGGVNIH
jgi:hypothetical protein